jgi:hypothetical protein
MATGTVKASPATTRSTEDDVGAVCNVQHRDAPASVR